MGVQNCKSSVSESSENDQVTGHFQSFFLISPEKNSKTSKANQLSVLNFPKNLDRIITFYSVTLKNTQTEPHNFFFSTKQIIFRVGG